MCQAHAAMETLDPLVMQRLLEHREQFEGFLARRLRDPEAAADVLQDAFLKSVDRLSTLRDPESAVAWFYRVLRNAVTDRYRAWGADAARRSEVEPAEIEATEPVAEGRPCACVHHAIGQLKPDYAEILRAVELEGEQVKAWAARMNTNANNAGVKVFRARAALLREIRHTCGACAEGHCRDCTCAA